MMAKYNAQELAFFPILTIEECAFLYKIGENKLRNLISNNPNAVWLLRSGSWVRIKRKLFDDYINSINDI